MLRTEMIAFRREGADLGRGDMGMAFAIRVWGACRRLASTQNQSGLEMAVIGV